MFNKHIKIGKFNQLVLQTNILVLEMLMHLKIYSSKMFKLHSTTKAINGWILIKYIY